MSRVAKRATRIVGSTLRNPDATTPPEAPLFNVAGVALALCLNVERALPFPSTNRRQLPDRSSFVANADGTAAYAGQGATC